jgi:hypothetical protein
MATVDYFKVIQNMPNQVKKRPGKKTNINKGNSTCIDIALYNNKFFKTSSHEKEVSKNCASRCPIT